jgi:methionyl aminopeptidase
MQTQIKTPVEIAAMREGGHMLATVLRDLSGQVEPGISTKDLAEIAKQKIGQLGGQPTTLGYHGFPDVICISVNDEVVHGIPRPGHIINDGDIVSLDFCVTHKGMITDAAISVIAGKPSSQNKDLLIATERSLMAGISAVTAGARVGDISAAVQASLNKHGTYGIIRDLVGHGVGHEMHEEPNIPNYGKKGTGQTLVAGMTLAIEPMATLGSFEIQTDPDNWTIRTKDGSLAAHFEHTVLVTNDGVEILTTL